MARDPSDLSFFFFLFFFSKPCRGERHQRSGERAKHSKRLPAVRCSPTDEVPSVLRCPFRSNGQSSLPLSPQGG